MKHRHLILAFITLIVPPSFGIQAGEIDHDAIWHAICQVESSGNPDAHNPGEDARGIAQIRAIMVEDVNRIVGSDKYTHDDAWCAEKSREMFDIYNRHYHPKGDYERIARCWQGGPKGHLRESEVNDAYWAKVQKELER
jgi:hypothetical protein